MDQSLILDKKRGGDITEQFKLKQKLIKKGGGEKKKKKKKKKNKKKKKKI